MNDIYGVKCDLPEPPTRLGDYDREGTPAAGVLVSVSNDGFRTSAQELRQVTYDSKCMTCSKAGNCQRKVSTGHIGPPVLLALLSSNQKTVNIKTTFPFQIMT